MKMGMDGFGNGNDKNLELWVTIEIRKVLSETMEFQVTMVSTDEAF